MRGRSILRKPNASHSSSIIRLRSLRRSKVFNTGKSIDNPWERVARRHPQAKVYTPTERNGDNHMLPPGESEGCPYGDTRRSIRMAAAFTLGFVWSATVNAVLSSKGMTALTMDWNSNSTHALTSITTTIMKYKTLLLILSTALGVMALPKGGGGGKGPNNGTPAPNNGTPSTNIGTPTNNNGNPSPAAPGPGGGPTGGLHAEHIYEVNMIDQFMRGALPGGPGT
ncbi:hypothetical protein QBC35DRAFT_536669 [Podospora australis]|uniref:Uncharacterized protein n=1 Tax=Podospora australis TaxID=1536484 RepID=A0AAN6WJ00_9PEZI|nr:hypothetical protein QBC35DRAFT_536669 [Podospora australis]